MIEETLIVGLALECRRVDHAWAEAQGGVYAWRPIAVFAVAPPVAPWTSLGATATGRRYYAGPQSVHLCSVYTANYRDNLASEHPKLWVVLRGDGAAPPIEVAAVTADPAEGEAMTESGNDTVEVIDMPAEVAAEIAAFVVAHHVERPHIKRKRDRAAESGRDRSVPGSGGRFRSSDDGETR